MHTSKYEKMKKIGLFILSCYSICTYAQQYTQAYGYGTNDEEYGLHIRVDDEGNAYSVGGYESTIDFGDGKTLTANGTPPVGLYVAKHNANGEIQWVVNGGTDEEELFYIDLDTAGNVYVAGSFLGTQTYGGNTFTTMPTESNDNFIMKINKEGTVVWSRHMRGPDHEHIQGLAVSDNGDIYVSGFFDATFTYEGTTLTNNGSSDIFVLKFDTDNNFIWGKANGSTGLDWPWDIDVDENGNLYLAGQFSASFNWDTESVNLIDNQDMLVVKMNSSDGSVQFAKSFGGNGADEARGIVADPSNNIYVSGYFTNSIDFGTTTLSSSGTADGFIFKLDGNGNHLWSKAFGGSASDTRVVAPTLDVHGNVYVGGSFNRDIVADGFTFENSGSRDAFIGKYLKNGDLEKGIIIGGTNIDQLGGIAINDQGKTWITGRFASKTIAFGATSLSNAGTSTPDVFLAEVTGFATGIANLEQSDNFSVQLFPNPSDDVLTVKSSGQSMEQLILHNAAGQWVAEYEINSKEAKLNIRTLHPGIYYMDVIANGVLLKTSIQFIKK